jgi:ATP-binding cassette, subfamily B, heavy metal transporter
MGTFNLLPIMVEIILTLTVFATLFSWEFFLL